MSTPTGRSVRGRKAAAELKRLRELALLTADEVGQRVGWSASKMSRIENARIRLKTSDVQRLLSLYEAGDAQRDKLLSLVEDDGRRKWWDAYADILTPDFLTFISFEAEASTALNYEPMVIPGLLQTEAYARRVIYMWQSIMNAPPPPDLERRLEVRLKRQRILWSDSPLDLTAVIDEGVLRRQIDECSVMRGQLHHLIDMARLPNVKIQVLPLAGRHVTSTGPLIYLHIPEFGDVLHLENFLTGDIYIDNTAAIYQHNLVFRALREASLDLEASRELIERTARELW